MKHPHKDLDKSNDGHTENTAHSSKIDAPYFILTVYSLTPFFHRVKQVLLVSQDQRVKKVSKDLQVGWLVQQIKT